MFDSLVNLFKKKPMKKPLYTKKQFTKYSNYKGDTYVYDSYSNQWLLWYLIASDVDDGNVSEFDMINDNDHALMESKLTLTDVTYLPEYTPVDSLSDSEKSINPSSYEDFGTSSNNSGSSYSSDSYSSSSDSYSSSSYDSGSSNSFSSSDGGGGCF